MSRPPPSTSRMRGIARVARPRHTLAHGSRSDDVGSERTADLRSRRRVHHRVLAASPLPGDGAWMKASPVPTMQAPRQAEARACCRRSRRRSRSSRPPQMPNRSPWSRAKVRHSLLTSQSEQTPFAFFACRDPHVQGRRRWGRLRGMPRGRPSRRPSHRGRESSCRWRGEGVLPCGRQYGMGVTGLPSRSIVVCAHDSRGV